MPNSPALCLSLSLLTQGVEEQDDVLALVLAQAHVNELLVVHGCGLEVRRRAADQGSGCSMLFVVWCGVGIEESSVSVKGGLSSECATQCGLGSC